MTSPSVSRRHPWLAVAAAGLATLAKLAHGQGGTVQMEWTTDLAGSQLSWGDVPSTFGPDGPWQAVVATIGNSSASRRHMGVRVPLWPSGTEFTEVLATKGGGNYSMQASNSSAKAANFILVSNDDQWSSGYFSNRSTLGCKVSYDQIRLGTTSVDFNVSICAVDSRVNLLPRSPGNGTTWSLPNYTEPPMKDHPTLLNQLKATGRTASASFGLHMGSAALGQPGSLVLGGYDLNRALGPVAVLIHSASSGPSAFLRDVVLGVQTGGSPFGSSLDATSVYRGLGNVSLAVDMTKIMGGVPGSAVVIPSPASPYIYLPPGTCEQAARHLPVNFDERLQLFLWNTTDPQYRRIVNSPAYLGFVLADRTATNITIKVPFKLLNLTLEAPLVTTPTSYFPCRPLASINGYWQLGRAFLQAAFMAVNHEQNVTFLAQAPGPNMGQRVIQSISKDDTTIRTADGNTFADTWNGVWQPLSTHSAVSPLSYANISAAAIAGITIGAVAGALMAAVVAVVICRKRKESRRGSGEHPGKEAQTAEFADNGTVNELEPSARLELGAALPHEMEAKYETPEALGPWHQSQSPASPEEHVRSR